MLPIRILPVCRRLSSFASFSIFFLGGGTLSLTHFSLPFLPSTPSPPPLLSLSLARSLARSLALSSGASAGGYLLEAIQNLPADNVLCCISTCTTDTLDRYIMRICVCLYNAYVYV